MNNIKIILNYLIDVFTQRTFGALRSSQWFGVRNAWIKDHPLCAVCETKGTLLNGVEVHHIAPFHLHPELELDPTNFITLCRQHHYLFGHFMNWSKFNVDVRVNTEEWNEKIKNIDYILNNPETWKEITKVDLNDKIKGKFGAVDNVDLDDE